MGWRDSVSGNMERYPRITDELKNIGDSVYITFLDDGREVLAEKLKGKMPKGVKARDSLVFVVEKNDKTRYELWMGTTNYTSLNELKTIAPVSLIGVRVKLTRVEKDNPDKASFHFERA